MSKQNTMPSIEDAKKDFSRAVNALMLELPKEVWVDFHFRWIQLQDAIAANLKLQGKQGGWVSIKDKLPDVGQIVDIWEMPMTQHLERALSLKGTVYANEYYDDTYYNGWRSTNYKFSIEDDGEGNINCFTKCNERYFTIPKGGANYKKLCVENGEVTHWKPISIHPTIN